MPAPPNALPVARFLVFERTYPDSVAASVDAVHNALYRADGNPRNSEPVLRLQRLSADLEFRGRAEADGGDLHATCEAVQEELVRVDRDIADRYFAGAPAPSATHGRCPSMNFAIRYLTEYRYEGQVADNLNALRVRPATTSTQRVDDFHVRVDPEARLQRHLDYYGTEVIEFGVAQPHDHLSIDVRARVVTAEPADPPDEGWEALEAGSYEAAGGEFLLSDDAEPENGALDELFEASRATSPLATLRLLCELVPDRFEYRRGRHVRRLHRPGPARRRRGRVPGLRPPRARAAAPPRDRGALRLGLPVGRAPATAARTRSRSTPTPGWRRCCPAAASAASRCGSAPTRPTAGWRGRPTSRSATAAPTPTCRRSRASTAARRRRARRGGDDDAPGPAGQRARLSAPGVRVAYCGPTVSSSPLNPHPASPVEMQERIRAERDGMPFLLLRDGAGTQQLVRLPTDGERLTIGRGEGVDLALDWDERVSRVHAELEHVGESWAVADDGLSRNGTYVNGKRVRGRQRLEEGDELRLGGHADGLPLARGRGRGRGRDDQGLPERRRLHRGLRRPAARARRPLPPVRRRRPVGAPGDQQGDRRRALSSACRRSRRTCARSSAASGSRTSARTRSACAWPSSRSRPGLVSMEDVQGQSNHPLGP